MDEKIKLLISELGEDRIKQDYDLSSEISNQTGKAKGFFIATSQRELIRVIGLCKELQIDFLLIGAGTKVRLSPEEFPGLVIKNRSDNIRLFGIKGKVSQGGLGVEEASLEVDSGVSLKFLVEYTSKQKLVGLDNLASLPGTIGGNLFLPSLRMVVDQVKVLTDSDMVEIKPTEKVSNSDIILSAVFKLKALKK